MNLANDIDTLARTLYGEAEAGNVEDAKAIACVVMNRVRWKNWPGTVTAVCLQPWQFSCWNQNDPNRARILAAHGLWFKECKNLARKAVQGDLEDVTCGATHYYATYLSAPVWAKKRKACHVVEHRSGSAHLFFNDVDTPAPQCAAGALDQVRPIHKSRSVQGAGVAAAGVAAGEIVTDLQDQIQPLVPYADMLKYVFLALALVGIGITLYARLDDRRKGLR